MTKKGILFDMDGTLINTYENINFRQALSELKTVQKTLILKILKSRVRSFAEMETRILQEVEDPAEGKELVRRVSDFLLEHYDNAPLKKDALMLGFGDMLSLVCALFFALHIIALERYSAHVDTVCMTALQMMTAGVISTICALTLEQPPTSFNWHAAGNVAYLIFVSTLLAYLLQTFAQKFTTANSASLILSMEALFASIFSFLLLGEVMSPPMILGACLIFSSILYIEYKPARKKKDKQQDIC